MGARRIDYCFTDDGPGGTGTSYRLARRCDSLTLFKDSAALHIGRRTLQVLEYIWAESTTFVGVADLKAEVWPGLTHANPANYTKYIRELFGDTPPYRLVETKPGSIRFMLPVTIVDLESPDPLEHGPGTLRLLTLSDLPGIELIPEERIVALLEPSYRAFPFIGREEEQGALWKWVTGDAPISFHILSGHGGTGKTRLAIRLMERLGDKWHAGFLLPGEDLVSVARSSRWHSSKPTLVVLDNAAHWEEMLAATIRILPATPGSLPLRFLLIERSADSKCGWFCDVLAEARGHKQDWFPFQPIHLRELTQKGGSLLEERTRLIRGAFEVLHRFTGAPELQLTSAARQDLAAEEMGDPLVLLMAAIVSHTRGSLAPLIWRRIDLAESLAIHEKLRIGSLSVPLKPAIPDPEFLVLHLAAYVTLAGGLTRDELIAACDEEKSATEADSRWAGRSLARFIEQTVLPCEYPGIAAAPIMPDVVGSVFVDLVFQDPYQDPDKTIARAFSRRPGFVFASLVRMVQDFAPNGGELSTRQSRPLKWLTNLQGFIVPSLTEQAFWQIHSSIPLTSVVLGQFALRFYSDIVEQPTSVGTKWLSVLAEISLTRHALIQHDYLQSLRCARKAFDACRNLDASQSDPSWLWSGLFVDALNCLVLALSRTGHYREALAQSFTAVTQSRELEGKTYDETFRRALAVSLHNHAFALAETGETLAALRPIKEAITLWMAALKNGEKIALRNLVSAMRDQSIYQGRLNQEGALESAALAVRWSEELAATNPDSFEPDLASSLHRQAAVYFDRQNYEAAAELGVKALEIARRLVSRDRSRFLHLLAGALTNLANVESRRNRAEAAYSFVTEAVTCLRELVSSNRKAFLEDLVKALVVQSDGLCVSQSRIVITEAIGYSRELSTQNPLRYLPLLAMCYGQLGTIYLRAEPLDRAAARDAFAEGLRCAKPCAIWVPESQAWRIGQLLARHYAESCVMLGCHLNFGLAMPFLIQQAADSTERCQLMRDLILQTPVQRLQALEGYFGGQQEWGSDSLMLASETRDRRAVLLRDNAAILRDRALVLVARARELTKLGALDRAADSFREAIPFWRILVRSVSDEFVLYLTNSLVGLAVIIIRAEQGLTVEPVSYLDEAVEYYRELINTGELGAFGCVADVLMAKAECLTKLAESKAGHYEFDAWLLSAVQFYTELSRGDDSDAYWVRTLREGDCLGFEPAARAVRRFETGLKTLASLLTKYPDTLRHTAEMVQEYYVMTCRVAGIEPDPALFRKGLRKSEDDLER